MAMKGDGGLYERKCPVCGRIFIQAPKHRYRAGGKLVCSWGCACRADREKKQKKREKQQEKEDGMRKNTELNERQIALLKVIRENPDEWMTQERIADRLPQFYPAEEGKPFRDTTSRRLMSADIRAIRNDRSVDVIVMSTGRGIRIASAAQCATYFERRKAAQIRALADTYRQERKAALDGQYRIGADTEPIRVFAKNCWRDARKNTGMKQAEVCEIVRRYDGSFTEPILSMIETGRVNPTAVQEAALLSIYGEDMA